MIYLGDDKIGRLYLGGTEIGKAYLGSDLVFQKNSGPRPEYYEKLYFDGNSYVQTDIVLPENCSIRVWIGGSRARTNQCIFEATTLGGSGTTGYYFGTNTNPVNRQLIPYYDSSTWLASDRTMGFDDYDSLLFFMTPYRYGQGSTSWAYTKGSSHPTSELRVGGTYGGGSPLYTGFIGMFLIYGSDASGCTRDSDFDSYTPVYTLRPCIYEGQVGLWNVQEGKFYGNSGTGTLRVSWALPAEYKQVQYIQTAGKAHIDTGVAGATDLQVLMRFSASSFVQYGSFYGNYIDESHKANRLLFSTSSSNILVAGGNNLATTVGNFSLNTIFYFLVRSDKAYRNSAAINISADSKTANTTNIALGANKVGGVTGADKGQRYYNFLIVKGTNLVRDYVPCKRVSDDVAGFYDMINNIFYPSEVTEQFIAGPEV